MMQLLRALRLLTSQALAKLVAFGLAVGAPLALAGLGGAGIYAWASVGPAYVDNVVDQTCTDGGTLVQPPAAAVAVEAECSGNAYFGHESAVPLTGIAASSFSARAPSIRCRSQSNVTCDFRFLVSTSPSEQREAVAGLSRAEMEQLVEKYPGSVAAQEAARLLD